MTTLMSFKRQLRQKRALEMLAKVKTDELLAKYMTEGEDNPTITLKLAEYGL